VARREDDERERDERADPERDGRDVEEVDRDLDPRLSRVERMAGDGRHG